MSLLSFSDAERNHVDTTTAKQWQCEEWYLHKAGFITASKCKRVFTRQETLEKNNEENVIKLVQDVALPQNTSRATKLNHKMPGSGGYSMKRVLARHISVLLAIPTTNCNWSLKAFLFQSQNLSLVLAWIIFSSVSVLMVVQTKLWNINAPGNTEICTQKRLS